MARRQLPVVALSVCGSPARARCSKAATRWTERDLSGLRAFLDRTPDCRAAVLACNGGEAVKLGERLWVIPMGHLLR